ncbi:hypothetical protein SPRG_03206 [Saprolegnia parasitica CBS 223.65]|uniref:Tudor domain-containing protein n=1 Tax=Saprolegnia parasitica (strain CBS 223.65) TaxID=695850 RepID=A0A067CRV4_SAPPC|nr:hypothetical protein SPRG_03206 [Saprolegnia parasitica CBS 223.65]KDO31990.1 hypothetical protein SPRG_03206 [Saprolegnia parasitica CBS 223.65]|eukprot:XP_012197185.1 hypothetical protein SPRG_03206 [Saprolegnia parasitica CBS 223.65]
MQLRVGVRVDGLYAGGDVWFPGSIVDANDGLFSVRYDDGELEENVPERLLRLHEVGTWTVGSRVLARYNGDDDFYPGTITAVDDETRQYDIAYDDGEVEENVSYTLILDEDRAPDSARSESSLVDGDVPPIGENDDDNATEARTVRDAVAPEPSPSTSTPDSTPAPPPVPPPDATAPVAETADTTTTVDAPAPEATVDTKIPDPAEPQVAPSASVELHPRPPPHRESARQSMDDAATHGDEPLATLLHCDVEVQALLSTMGEPVRSNDDLLVVKNALAQLLHQLRVAPHVTTDLCAQHRGEARLLQCIQDNVQHSILVCFCFVIIRRLCSVSDTAFDTFLAQDVLSVVANVMVRCPQDAVLQASACGVLATFARGAGLDRMLQLQLAQLILTVLLLHQPLNHYSRQVHYYACEVLLRLADTSDKRVLSLMSAVDATNGSTAMHLLVILLRQGHQHEDQKVACAACTLVLCLAAKDRQCAEVLRSTEALSDISTVMAKYPNDNGISHYSTVATREIALATMKTNGPTKVHEKAAAILSTPTNTAVVAPSTTASVLAPSSSKKQLLKPPTPSKKSQAFSRNSIAPAPKLSTNVNASLSKMQVMARIKSPPLGTSAVLGTSASTVLASHPVRTPLKPSSPERLVKHHRFIPFEDKLEWRLLQATPKKTLASPTVRTVERESLLMQTYGVSTLREMHFPPSKATYAKEKTSPQAKPVTPQSPPKTPAATARSSPQPPKNLLRGTHEPSTPITKPASVRPLKELPRAARQPIVKYKVQIDAKPTETTRAPKSTINHKDILDQRAMNQLATQLFHEPASPVATPTSPDTKKAVPEAGRRSFSDKLHEMIRTAEEALCRPPSATNLLALRAATPPSLQFSAAEIPPKPTTPKPPVVPKPTEPDTFPVAELASNASASSLERRQDISIARRASTGSERRKSLESGLASADLRRASSSGQDHVASLHLKPVLHRMDTCGTSRSTSAMAQEQAMPTDRTAVSEYPMPSDTETPRFDTELDLLRSDEMPESARESEDDATDDGRATTDVDGAVVNIVAEDSVSGDQVPVPTELVPDDDGEVGDSDYNDDEFEEAVNESGDASEPPVDVDAVAPEENHETPRSVVELDCQPLEDVNEPLANDSKILADANEPVADTNETSTKVNEDLDVDEKAPGGSEACKVPAAAPLPMHQEWTAEPPVNDNAAGTWPAQESSESPTTERDATDNTEKPVATSGTLPVDEATSLEEEPSRADVDAPIVASERCLLDAAAADNASEEAELLCAEPSADEPSHATSGDDDRAPCNDDPVPALTTSVDADPVALEQTKGAFECPEVPPHDAPDLVSMETTVEPATETSDVPVAEAGINSTHSVEHDANAAADADAAAEVAPSEPVANGLLDDTTSNLPPEIEYEEEVYGDDNDDGAVTTATSDVVSVPSFDYTPAPAPSAEGDLSTDAAVDAEQDALGQAVNAATREHDASPPVLESNDEVLENAPATGDASSNDAPIASDESGPAVDNAPAAVEIQTAVLPSPRAESSDTATPRPELVTIDSVGVTRNDDAEASPPILVSGFIAEAPTPPVLSDANAEPTPDVWEGDEYAPNDAATDEAFTGLVNDYDKASSTASLADNARFDSDFEGDDGAMTEAEAANVVTTSLLPSVHTPLTTARESSSERSTVPEPVVVEPVDATPTLVDESILAPEPSDPISINPIDEADTTLLQAGGLNTLSTTSLGENERTESDFKPVDDVLAPSVVVPEATSPRFTKELGPEPLAASENVPAPSPEAAKEAPTKSSDDSEQAPVCVLQTTSSAASLDDSTRFESDFEADDAPPDASDAPVAVVTMPLEHESPGDTSTRTHERLEPQERAESEPLPSKTTSSEMPSTDAPTADPIEDPHSSFVATDDGEYEGEYGSEYDDAPAAPDVAPTSTDTDAVAPTDHVPTTAVPPLALTTPSDEGASQTDDSRPPPEADVASEPAIADPPTHRQTADNGTIEADPVDVAAPIQTTAVGTPRAAVYAVQDEVVAPPPSVSADPTPQGVATPRAPEDSTDAEAAALPTSARVEDPITSSGTPDAPPSARPLEVPALALPRPSLESVATEVPLSPATNAPATTPSPQPESSRIPAPPTTTDDDKADDDDDDNPYADDDDYGDDDFED